MQYRKGLGQKFSARLLAACLTVFALVTALLPAATGAQTGQGGERPRRVEPASGATGTTPQAQKPAPVASQTQTTPAPQSTPAAQSGQEPQGEEVDENDVVKVDASLVNLNVRVVDRQNRPVNDIRQDEFRVLEDGVMQQVAFFTREEVPIQYGLVIDNSGSLRFQLDKVIEAGKTIVNSNKPGDETFLVRFTDSSNIEVERDFTPKKEEVVDALDNLYIQAGQTAVLDAVYLSAERVAKYKKGSDLDDRRRRALILVTDGEDRDSFYKKEQLFDFLRENDVQIYVIGFVNELDKEGGFVRKSRREQAVDLLNRLAKETGGRAFFPNSLSELPQIAQDITRDLRTQYVIGYSPTNKARDGSFRSVRVSIADAPGRDKRIAITRPGYNAPRDGAPLSRKQ